MKLADTKYDNAETGCCPRLDAKDWDEQEFIWKGRLFLKDHIRSFLHIPLNFGSVIHRDHEIVESNAAYPEQPLWLTEDVSPWGTDMYLALDRELADVEIVRMSGTFLTKVFEGPYRDSNQWLSRMDAYVQQRGKTSIRTFFYCATCPKCAKYFGKNQVVLFSQVE